ncbi:hypothetical protein PanWU01x14_304050 [Parasponia andersonii]|uniref:NSF attachment protein n=1 Tax=Parasponia andersonii TaxID=3476 RepID=A0A2P5ASQ4_PARAD|nr:hypothetical protein PanWU01x14_304050 [Parasponia andersonii]
MATICFERAYDTYWERMSKAAGLKAMADRMRLPSPEEANSVLREAAEIFEAIGKADSATRCFSDLGEYERAGVTVAFIWKSLANLSFKELGNASLWQGATDVYARGRRITEAANIAKLKGDTLLLVDLLEKAGKFKEAANLILFYVLANSLCSPGNKGWPLNQFKQKGELLPKAKSFAEKYTNSFYEIVCSEADIIANEDCEVVKAMNQMIASTET